MAANSCSLKFKQGEMGCFRVIWMCLTRWQSVPQPTAIEAKAMGELGGKCALSRAFVDLLPRLEPIVLGVGRTVFTYV
jgi:hypothetical protein